MSNQSTDERVTKLYVRLRDGCGSCSFDEAEGALVDHCDECLHAIAQLAYALIVSDGWQLKSAAELRLLTAERDAARLVAKKRLDLLVAEGIV
jgi:hypothetical protein